VVWKYVVHLSFGSRSPKGWPCRRASDRAATCGSCSNKSSGSDVWILDQPIWLNCTCFRKSSMTCPSYFSVLWCLKIRLAKFVWGLMKMRCAVRPINELQKICGKCHHLYWQCWKHPQRKEVFDILLSKVTDFKSKQRITNNPYHMLGDWVLQ